VSLRWLYHPRINRPSRIAVAAVILAAAWMTTTVYTKYGGKWTGLFCIGGHFQISPGLAAENPYLFEGTVGHDGQQYLMMARDPFLTGEDHRYMDSIRFRYRRIAIPLAAWSLAWGDPHRVTYTYLVVILAWIGAGTYWFARIAQGAALPAALGLTFLLMPGALVSIERMLVDVGLSTLAAALVVAEREDRRSLRWTALILAPLVRETGWLFLAAAGLVFLAQRRWRDLPWLGLTAVPALTWAAYLNSRTIAQTYQASYVPFSAIWKALQHPYAYGPQTRFVPLLVPLDTFAIFGMLLAFAMAVRWLATRPWQIHRVAAALFALLGVLLQRDDQWVETFEYSRIFSPLLVFLILDGSFRRLLAWIPLVPIDLRLGVPFALQLIRIVRVIFPA
jgi:hypothetical protein